jgi:hypothetical protein
MVGFTVGFIQAVSRSQRRSQTPLGASPSGFDPRLRHHFQARNVPAHGRTSRRARGALGFKVGFMSGTRGDCTLRVRDDTFEHRP